jgi:hypothetical protein
MEKTENNFEIGGWAKHLHVNTAKELYIVNVAANTVLVRYAVDGIFHSQEFFKHELKLHNKKTSVGVSSITF